MKTTKEQADELVKQFKPLTDESVGFNLDIQCAILSVKHTIEVLDSLPLQFQTLLAINKQTELLTELESRL